MGEIKYLSLFTSSHRRDKITGGKAGSKRPLEPLPGNVNGTAVLV